MLTVRFEYNYKCNICGRSDTTSTENTLPKGWDIVTVGGVNHHICNNHKVIVVKVDDKVIAAKQID